MRAWSWSWVLASGCVIEVPDTTAPTVPEVPPAEVTCDVPEYGDGTCQTEIGCEAPDIDCFTFFEGPDEAAAWFAELEARMAAQEVRAPRELLPTSDERWIWMAEKLREGWAAYKAVNDVADLAERTPELVVVVDETQNAFVAPDLATETSAFAVMVHSALIESDHPDDAVLGVVMHELEHAVRLHGIGDVRDRIRKYYVAGNREPLGFRQDDDPVARQHGERWRSRGAAVGPFADRSLGRLPLSIGQLGLVFLNVVASRTEPRCEGPVGAWYDLHDRVVADIDTFATTVEADLSVADDAEVVLADLRDRCMTEADSGFVEVVGRTFGISEDEVRAGLEPDDLALVEGQHFVDGMAALVDRYRADMRAAEKAFADETGARWTDLRFYSYEEAADDATVPVLTDLGLAPEGQGDFLFAIQSQDDQDRCAELLDAGTTPPYGGDLSDEHHGTCWRVDHVRAVVDDRSPPNARTLAAPSAPPATPPLRLVPPRLADRLVY